MAKNGHIAATYEHLVLEREASDRTIAVDSPPIVDVSLVLGSACLLVTVPDADTILGRNDASVVVIIERFAGIEGEAGSVCVVR